MTDELKALTRAYGDGTINQTELQRLEILLQKDPQARQTFLLEMNLIHALEEMSLAAQPRSEKQNLVMPPVVRSTRWPFVWTPWASISVLAATLLIVASVVWLNSSSPEIGTIAEVHGSVRWTGQDGVVFDQLQAGDSLPGGTLEILAADAWASFRFHDGSIVTLSGKAEAVLSDRDQKQLLLRHGSFSADVEPQPTNSPMVVQTPAAEIQVLGTQFNVTVRTTETELKVNEGRVNFLRSSDGKVLEVPAEHLAIASLDAADNFTVQRLGAHPTTWETRLSSDADVMYGFWKPALFELASKLKRSVATGDITETDALIEYKKSVSMNNEGSVWAKPSKTGCLVWLNVSDEQRRWVLLTEQTQIRVSGRLFGSTELEMGLSTYAVSGGFSGKYSQNISTQKLKRLADGKFVWVINVGDLLSQSNEQAIDLLVQDWWCVTDSNTAKLEINRVEILDK